MDRSADADGERLLGHCDKCSTRRREIATAQRAVPRSVRVWYFALSGLWPLRSTKPSKEPHDSIVARSVATQEAVPTQRAHTSARPRGPPLPSLMRIASLHANRRVARDDDVGFLSPVTDRSVDRLAMTSFGSLSSVTAPGPWTDSDDCVTCRTQYLGARAARDPTNRGF